MIESNAAVKIAAAFRDTRKPSLILMTVSACLVAGAAHAGVGKLVASALEEVAGFLKAAPAPHDLSEIGSAAQKMPDLDWTPRIDLHGPRYRFAHQIPDEDTILAEPVQALQANAPPTDYSWLKLYLASRAASVSMREAQAAMADDDEDAASEGMSASPALTANLAIQGSDSSAEDIEAFLAEVSQEQTASTEVSFDYIAHVLDRIAADEGFAAALEDARSYASQGVPFDQESVEAAQLEFDQGVIEGRIEYREQHLATCSDLRSVATVDWPDLEAASEITFERVGEKFTATTVSVRSGEQGSETIVLASDGSGQSDFSLDASQGGIVSLTLEGQVLDAFKKEDVIVNLIRGDDVRVDLIGLSYEADPATEQFELSVLERRDGLALVEQRVRLASGAFGTRDLSVYDIEAGILLLTDSEEGGVQSRVETVSLTVSASPCQQ